MYCAPTTFKNVFLHKFVAFLTFVGSIDLSPEVVNTSRVFQVNPGYYLKLGCYLYLLDPSCSSCNFNPMFLK